MSGSTILKQFDFWIGIPQFSFSGPTTSVVGSMNQFYVNIVKSSGSSTTWSATPGCYEMYFYSPAMAEIIFTTVNSQHWVRADVSNVCGTTPYYYHFVDVDCWRPYPGCNCQGISWSPPPYPNPASDVFYINIDAEVIALAQSQLQTITDGKSLKSDLTFDIRLYDGQGNLLRQQTTKGGTLRFNVSSLPVGVYYLHIYNGVSSTPEIQQIMVER